MSEEVGLVAEVLGEAEAGGVDVAEAYRVTTIIPYAEKPHEKETYTLPAVDLDGFFHDYCQTAEIVVDVRPVQEVDDG